MRRSKVERKYEQSVLLSQTFKGCVVFEIRENVDNPATERVTASVIRINTPGSFTIGRPEVVFNGPFNAFAATFENPKLLFEDLYSFGRIY